MSASLPQPFARFCSCRLAGVSWEQPLAAERLIDSASSTKPSNWSSHTSLQLAVQGCDLDLGKRSVQSPGIGSCARREATIASTSKSFAYGERNARNSFEARISQRPRLLAQ